MFPGTLLDAFTPVERIAIASAPFAGAIILRVAFGRHPIIRWLVTITTLWFTLNVLLAPYSSDVRQDILEIPARFR